MSDADVEALIVEVLKSGEWKEEKSNGGKKIWYWLKKDKNIKMKSRKELGIYLVNQRKATVKTPSAQPGKETAAPTATDGGANKVAIPTDSTIAAPDAAIMANMGVLGTDVDSMNDAQELRNQVRMWEAKYKVLLDENKRLLMGKGVGAPVAGTIVPSDLQLKYDALVCTTSPILHGRK